MVQLIENQPPLPLAPVYYCPYATTGIASNYSLITEHGANTKSCTTIHQWTE